MLDAVKARWGGRYSSPSLSPLSPTPLPALLPDCQPSSPTQTPGAPPDAGTCHPRLSSAEPPRQRDVPALPYSLASSYSLPTAALQEERLLAWLLTLR